MALSKSQVEFYLDLCQHLVSDDPLDCTSPKDLRMDLATLVSRTHAEGLSFLSKTLPLLGRALDAGLICQRLTVPREFKRSHGNRSIPAFLQAYFSRVFGEDGILLDEADPFAVKHLRQVLFSMYKLEVPYTPLQEAALLSSFKVTDSELPAPCDELESDLIDRASDIIGNIFSGFDPKDIIPRHGPGAVATGEKLDEKWDFSRLYSSIHQFFPYYEFFIVGGSIELIDRLAWYKSLQRCESGTAKVIFVPKDSRGPRLISAEPLEYQWIQQGLGREIVSHLESHIWTKGKVNFTSQDINRQLALRSSSDCQFATLDLKDASDRVSLALVRRLFKHNSTLLRALEAARTTSTRLPSGEIVPLSKFAPMGSALCFPVEAVCFWAICVAAISMANSDARPPSVGKHVYVYGDDIIVPRGWAHVCIQALESCSLRVNTAKSCIEGQFKESCGMDAFRGVPVTPTRFKKLFTGIATDGSAYASYVALANAMSLKGYKNTSALIWKNVEAVYGVVPHGLATTSFPCRVVSTWQVAVSENLRLGFKSRYDRNLQHLEFRVQRLKGRKIRTSLDGWQRLLRNLVLPPIADDPSAVVVPRSTRIKRGWARV
jgi:hypothetical protein